MNVGDYGEISFTIKKKRKYPIPGDYYMTMGFIMRGTIIDVDDKNILFRDNDDMEYLVTKSRIREFVKLEFKTK